MISWLVGWLVVSVLCVCVCVCGSSTAVTLEGCSVGDTDDYVVETIPSFIYEDDQVTALICHITFAQLQHCHTAVNLFLIRPLCLFHYNFNAR